MCVGGGYSLIKAELKLYKKASESYRYEYYHLLSGVDLPIKTQDFIHNFFDTYSGMEFITTLRKEFIDKQGIKFRSQYYYFFQDFERKNKYSDFFNSVCIDIQKKFRYTRKPIEELSYGSNWASLTNDSVNYLLSQEKEIKRKYKYSYCGDEFYKQTILSQSNFAENFYLKNTMKNM